ncbi:hypothetical protein ACQZ63_23710 [Agrobacterium sp. CG160-95]|jgi:hypothetical protein
MRNIIISIIETARVLASDFRDWIRSHFDMFVEPGTNTLNSVYLKMPGTGLELFVERSNLNVGFSYERTSGNVEFFLGKVRGVVSIETKAARQAR